MKLVVFLAIIIVPLIGISQDNNIDTRLIGKWKFKHVEDEKAKKARIYLVKESSQPKDYNSYFIICITEKGVTYEQRIGPLICVGATKIDSTSCTIDNNKISTYIRSSYHSGEIYSESKEVYEIISIKTGKIELKELESKTKYF